MSTVATAPRRADAATPFFIVGSGRSGSTLLRLMLCSHSRLTIPPETWYLLPLLQRLSVDRPLDAAETETAVAIMTGHYRWPDLKLDSQEFRRAVHRLTAPSVRDLVEVVYRWYVQAEGKARWGDKTPAYIEIVPELARMFPGARFIHLVRDGRDVAKSFQTTDWVGRWLHLNTREWSRALDYQRRWADSELRQQMLEVRYEDLVLETEVTLRRICQFIGEEFETQMLSWERTVDGRVPEREREYHTKLKLRIGAEGVSRWKREMSARETFVSESFMGAHLKRLGYERRYPSPLWAPFFALTRLYCRIVLPAVDLQLRVLRFFRNRIAPRLGVK
jgi:Sulfotransferase family